MLRPVAIIIRQETNMLICQVASHFEIVHLFNAEHYGLLLSFLEQDLFAKKNEIV